MDVYDVEHAVLGNHDSVSEAGDRDYKQN